MTKIAIIDMEFHKKTKSFDFLLDIIRQCGDVSFFYDDSLTGGGKHTGYLTQHFDIYIYLQIYPTRYDLRCLKGKKIIFVPMYDGMVLHPFVWKWMSFWDVRILAFSTKIRDYFLSLGYKVLYTQYFLPPLAGEISHKKKTIYRRYRGSITRDMVKRMLGSQYIDGLTIKNIPDPGYPKLSISQEDQNKYHITFIDTFYPTPVDAYKDLTSHSIYIAPRKQEGIGMTMLESLSLGQCVIANNDGTMNEYIIHGENGILTDFSRETDLSDYEKIGDNAKTWYDEKHKEWEKKEHEIKVFFGEQGKNILSLGNIIISFIRYIVLVIVKSIVRKIGIAIKK